MLGINESVAVEAAALIKAKDFAWVKKIAVFLAFQFVFMGLTMPLLVVYGPFKNIKKIFVGSAMATLSHQYYAKIFLSDDAIDKLLMDNGYYDTTEKPAEFNANQIKVPITHLNLIEVSRIDGGDFEGKLMVIYDPTRVEVGISSQMPKAGETTSTIAKKNNAVAAINAGGFIDTGWAGTGGTPDGFIIHNSKLISNSLGSEDVKVDTVAFTSKGVLVVGKHSIDDLKKYGVKEAVSFGPALIVNGKATIGSGSDGGWGIAPRTAIAQRADGAVMFLTIDGRSLKSLGGTLRDIQDIFLQHGAVNAVNLDGGSSTTMYYNGKIINKPSDGLGERAVPSAFLILPGQEGAK